MRVLSFIPAFLLAAASFVAAAPTAPSGSPVSTPSCVPAGTGNDAVLQPVISIIANATSQIKPLCDQLTFIQQGSGTPSADDISVIVVKITAVVSTCVTQLKATAKVELSGLDLTSLCGTIYALLTLVCTVLNALVVIISAVAGDIVATLKTVICNLLNAVIDLVGCLDVFVDASVSGVLGPVIKLVTSCVNLILGIVVRVGVSVH